MCEKLTTAEVLGEVGGRPQKRLHDNDSDSFVLRFFPYSFKLESIRGLNVEQTLAGAKPYQPIISEHEWIYETRSNSCFDFYIQRNIPNKIS